MFKIKYFKFFYYIFQTQFDVANISIATKSSSKKLFTPQYVYINIDLKKNL